MLHMQIACPKQIPERLNSFKQKSLQYLFCSGSVIDSPKALLEHFSASVKEIKDEVMH